MPYENEYANSFGYSEFLNEEFIKERLETYISFNKFDHISDFEIHDATPFIEESDEDINYIFAIDGSLSDVLLPSPEMEVGFIKIGVVIENLKKIKKLEKEQFIDRKELRESYKTYSVSGVLPGMGVRDTMQSIGEDSKDKFRKEIYQNMNNIYIDPSGVYNNKVELNLIDILLLLTPTKELLVQCSKCRRSSLVGAVPTKCSNCHNNTLYISDFLKLDEKYNNNLLNSTSYSECMSTFERILMCGLLHLASKSKNMFNGIVFVTDGPLALFRSKALSPFILDFLQSLPEQPPITGIEKTGQFVDFAHSTKVQKALKPGSILVVTEELAQLVSGQIDFGYSGESFYGRRFIYKTLDGHKTFVITVPPMTGRPYGNYDNVAHSIGNYPTLEKIIKMIEASKTNMFGVKTAAISSIAKANNVASIPQNFGVQMLEKLIEDNIDKI